ncbi:hypothetical protein A2803_00615 [Candidatus Woesebacteria bacterium RIFCSPHIGHO2_01_FULL_44_21]|uniref:Thioredoxin domain-containing protein n=1 Tax=Candidatus Woesebacteria bacterium RIFCSPHIGHO2_01_FULL_44_21 TaxID=1802503 RepID=A0A1F7Z005_9BACT|nr:MAG: hypothetical protein A2803_00615 [Candidatus Woesebacteria bacterium RIFCSPHIGHO2_01_FULL_44_21]OGM70365.1 MAG: hypothetical protein A2897_01045 [Candidatus Woesebacteria bacterium RIFCSPLOWO2_01_FULL_44_24b]
MQRGNFPAIVVIVVIVLALAGAAFYFLNRPGSGNLRVETQTPQATDTPETGSMSRYVEYSKRLSENSVDKRRVLFFYANWCPTCRPANAELEARISEIPEDVVVLRVNYNDTETDTEEEALAQKYGITYQHTFVEIDQDGNEVKKWNGGGLDQLLAQVN